MKEHIYFDNAATSRFKPKEVQKAAIQEIKNSANGGRSGHDDAVAAAVKIEEARSTILSFVNASNADVVFTKNCTEALNLGILGFFEAALKKDKSDVETYNASAFSSSRFDATDAHVITTAFDHNSTLRPLYQLKTADKVSLSVVNPDKNGVITADEIESKLQKNTKLVVLNYVSNVTGSAAEIMKIGRLLKAYSIPLLVDGAQAVPHLMMSMDDMNISMLACPGHKGLHGIQGTGFLVVKKNIALSPILFGGTGTKSDSFFQPTEMPEGFESGTLNTAGIAALNAGITWTEANLAKIRRHTEKIATEIMRGLSIIDAEIYTTDTRAGVISFNIKGRTSSETADFLNRRKIAVRSGLHCAPLCHKWLGTTTRGAVRASIGMNNTLSDAHALLNALEDFTHKA